MYSYLINEMNTVHSRIDYSGDEITLVHPDYALLPDDYLRTIADTDEEALTALGITFDAEVLHED